MGIVIALILTLFVGVIVFVLSVSPVILKTSDDAVRIDPLPKDSKQFQA